MTAYKKTSKKKYLAALFPLAGTALLALVLWLMGGHYREQLALMWLFIGLLVTILFGVVMLINDVFNAYVRKREQAYLLAEPEPVVVADVDAGEVDHATHS